MKENWISNSCLRAGNSTNPPNAVADWDPAVVVRHGKQKDAAIGYNPQKFDLPKPLHKSRLYQTFFGARFNEAKRRLGIRKSYTRYQTDHAYVICMASLLRILLTLGVATTLSSAAPNPNDIIIYGDVSNTVMSVAMAQKFPTPGIDQLAAEGPPQLYLLSADPAEQHNLLEDEPMITGEMKALLDQTLSR